MTKQSTFKPVTLYESPAADPASWPAFFTRTLGLSFESRYTIHERLGSGSMGDVFRITDRTLRRDLAMKTARAAMQEPRLIHRFHREAVVTAQLSHPAILPVFDVGLTAEGVPFYTMPVVLGDTLVVKMAEWSLGQSVSALVRAAEAVVHGHAKGVVHRDIKPSNIMIGAFGEVYLTDWGLVRILDGESEEAAPGPLNAGPASRFGRISGTPSFMAPEAALGLPVDGAADVFSLGAVLYELLSGTPPFYGHDPISILERVRTEPVEPLESRTRRPLPAPLVALCEQTLRRSPAQRPTAEALVAGLQEWVDGRQRGARGRARLSDGLRALRHGEQLHAESRVRIDAAKRALSAGEAVWDDLDAAQETQREASHLFEQARDTLMLAVSDAPDLVEAHAALIRLGRIQYDMATEAGRTTLAQRAEAEVATHAEAIRLDDAETTRWVAGNGLVSLPLKRSHHVEVARLVERQGRRVSEALPMPERWPAELPAGWVQVDLSKPGSARCRLIFEVARAAAFDPLEGRTPPMVRAEALAEDDIWVPAGWVFAGARHTHVEGFVIRRFPVTVGEYARFAEARGRLAELPEDWRSVARHPMVGLDASAIAAFVDWTRRTTRQPWRLCTELEWEKAASPDGRTYPWGERLRADWCAYDRSAPVEVDAAPDDVSPYGVRALAGCIHERCADRWGSNADVSVVRGGSWASAPESVGVHLRYRSDALPAHLVGFRLARSLRG